MSQDSCAVLIESPGWLDAPFYGKWLLAAAAAQNLWSEAVQSDCEFSTQIERQCLNEKDPRKSEGQSLGYTDDALRA